MFTKIQHTSILYNNRTVPIVFEECKISLSAHKPIHLTPKNEYKVNIYKENIKYNTKHEMAKKLPCLIQMIIFVKQE